MGMDWFFLSCTRRNQGLLFWFVLACRFGFIKFLFSVECTFLYCIWISCAKSVLVATGQYHMEAKRKEERDTEIEREIPRKEMHNKNKRQQKISSFIDKFFFFFFCNSWLHEPSGDWRNGSALARHNRSTISTNGSALTQRRHSRFNDMVQLELHIAMSGSIHFFAVLFSSEPVSPFFFFFVWSFFLLLSTLLYTIYCGKAASIPSSYAIPTYGMVIFPPIVSM